MKKSFLILLSISIPLFLVAQETPKQQEIGIVFNSLNSFGLTYKTGNSNSLWRFNTLFFSGNNSNNNADSVSLTQFNLGMGIKVGKEFRKKINENMEFRYGADVSFGYSRNENSRNDKTINNNDGNYKQITYTPGINLVLGLNYAINDHLILGAELMPYFSYSTGTSIRKNSNYYYSELEGDFTGFNYGLSNSSAMLSLVYKF
jgi:hypothetical protein